MDHIAGSLYDPPFVVIQAGAWKGAKELEVPKNPFITRSYGANLQVSEHILMY